MDPEDGLHRPVGTAVVHAVHGSKALLVNQGERLVSENLGPTSLQTLSLLRRHQELGLPEALLRVSYSEHPPLPRPGAAPTTFYYIIPTLPQAGEGFFTNKSSLTDSADEFLKESRTGKNILHQLIPLLRQSVYSRLAGYDDTNDADRLSQDPALRVVVGWKGPDRNAASTSEMGRFETELLTQKENLKGIERLNVEWIKRALAKTVHRRIILDIDSSESPVHGEQEEAAYNGHFGCMCYHPLFCFNQFGDCEGAVLRPGNVHSADGWKEFINPIVERYLKLAVRLLFRADAAFAKPDSLVKSLCRSN